MSIATFPLGPLQTNSYIVDNSGLALAVDVGGDPAPMLDYLQKNSLKLTAICLTHRHFDHVYGVAALAKATGAPVYSPDAEAVIAESESGRGGIWGMPKVEDFSSQSLKSGHNEFIGLECQVLETPGHTPGGVSLYFPALKSVFTGDALFCRSIGRTDFPGGSHQTLLHSIQDKLFTLPPETVVYPGHGEKTTIGDEMRHNPFCGAFAD